MEVNSRFWVLLSVGIIGLGVVITTLIGVGMLKNEWPDVVDNATPAVATQRPPTRAKGIRAGTALQARAAIDEVEARLSRKEALLAAKNRELAALRERIQSLRNELTQADQLTQFLVNQQLPDTVPDEAPAPELDADPNAAPSDVPDIMPVLEPPTEQELAELEAELALATARQQRLEAEELLASRMAVERRGLQHLGVLAVPGLIDVLQDPAPAVRQWACEALGQIGANATDAIRPLETAMSDPDPAVRTEAILALARIRE